MKMIQELHPVAPASCWDHREEEKKFDTILDFCVSSLRRGHANLLCIVPILTDDLRRGSSISMAFLALYICNIFPDRTCSFSSLP